MLESQNIPSTGGLKIKFLSQKRVKKTATYYRVGLKKVKKVGLKKGLEIMANNYFYTTCTSITPYLTLIVPARLIGTFESHPINRYSLFRKLE